MAPDHPVGAAQTGWGTKYPRQLSSSGLDGKSASVGFESFLAKFQFSHYLENWIGIRISIMKRKFPV